MGKMCVSDIKKAWASSALRSPPSCPGQVTYLSDPAAFFIKGTVVVRFE
jgi:hypothetical protein